MLPAFKSRYREPLRGMRCARRALGVFLVPFLAAALAVAMLAAPASATPGSGSASVIPTNPVVAGRSGSWTVTYTAAENFENPGGGVVEVWIPDRWTPPQTTLPNKPGYVGTSGSVDSISINGQVIRLRVGMSTPLLASQGVGVIYGVGGPASFGRADTVAPATASFVVRSAPRSADTLRTIAVVPSLPVVPDTVVSVQVVDAAGDTVYAFARTTDQDTTHLYLRGYDRFGNSARFVRASWTVSGGIGSPLPASGVGTVLSLTTTGIGKVYADSGAWHDSTGAVTVSHGSYAGLEAAVPLTATAGLPFAASAEAVDSDGNRVTSGAGSSASVRFVAHADSLGPTAADPSLVDSSATLLSGAWSGTLTARRAGTYFLSVKDLSAGFESSPRLRVTVLPGAPTHMALRPDTLRLVAGVPETTTVVLRDAFDNRAPVSADEDLTLWTDRPQGRFEDLAGSSIFSATVPAGSDSVTFRFVDTRTTAPSGRVRAIDANGSGPSLGTAESPVFTRPNAPAGSIALSAAPDTLTADGADSSRIVSTPIRDAYGNAVAAGERFTVTASGVSVITDIDPASSGAQWAAATDGTLSGWVRAGTTSGGGSAQILSERGSASGSIALVLRAGVPMGAIAVVADPDSVAADGIAIRTITASGIVDGWGNAVEDGEEFTVATTMGSIVSADQDLATPGVQVRASAGAITFDLRGGTALGTATVSVASVRGSANGSTGVRLVPGAIDADSSLASAGSPTVVGNPGSTLALTLRDRVGHPVAGVPWDSIAIAASGVSVQAVSLASSSDATGAIAFAITATSTGTASLEITARGTTLAAMPLIEFRPGPLDTLVVTGPSGPLTAGRPDSLRVEARDRYGNPDPSRSDLLHASVTSGAASGLAASVHLAGGVATFSFTPTAAAPLTIRIEDDSAHVTVYGPVAVNPGGIARVVADSLGSTTLAAGDSVAVRARVYDAEGNPIASAGVDAAVVAGGGSVAPSTATTTAGGAADFILRAGGAPGALVLRLASGGASDSVMVTVVPAAAASIEVVAADDSVRAGDFLDVALTLRDAFGNVASGATPRITLDTSSSLPDSIRWALGAGTGGVLTDTSATDLATYDFAPADQGAALLRVRGTKAETLRVSASGPGLPLAQSGVVRVTPRIASVLVLLSGNGQSAVVDHELAQPLRVSARDEYGNAAAAGDSVAFSVTAGGGSLDVIRGGAVQTVALTDGTGVAACEVARVGTVAGSANNQFRAGLPGFPAAEILFAASATPDTAATLALLPASLSLAAGSDSAVTVIARDRFGNRVPGASVTIYLGAPAHGVLESLGATSGSGTTQVGATDAAGEAAVRYRAPGNAPATDFIYARGTSIAPISIRADIGASGIDSLVLLPEATTWTAGVGDTVRVRALDSFGNLAAGDTATIVMGGTAGVLFNPSSGPLAAGVFTTVASRTTSGSVTLNAATASGDATGSFAPIVVVAAAPAGAVPGFAGRSELTADGRSGTTVTFGPVRDAYGNVTPTGSLLTVSAQAGTLFAADASPAPGLQIATGADSLARVALTAPTTPGPDVVHAASVAGSATGDVAVTYVAPPSLLYAAGSLAPTLAAPGQTYAFRVAVRNNAASGGVTIDTASVFSFGSGASAYAVRPSSALSLAAGQTDTLRFTAASVATDFAPGAYAPTLRLIGRDQTGDPYDFYLALSGAQVSVPGMRVLAVGASPNPVPLGYGNLVLTFRVENPAATPGSVESVSLSPPEFTVTSVAPSLPAVLPALGSVTFTVSVAVPASGIAPGTVGTRLHATASFGSIPAEGENLTPLDVQVISAAKLTAEAAGTSPARYLRGRTFAPTARLRNSGSAAVTLAQGATRLVLTRLGTQLETSLASNVVVAGGSAADLAFDSLAVPASAPLGTYAAVLALAGSESGQAFADTIPLDPASVEVLDPAILAVSVPVDPDTVSAGQTRSLRVVIANSGDVSFLVASGTRLTLGAPVFASLVPAALDTIPAHGSRSLAFAAASIGTASAPGSASATLEARGFEDGRPREEGLAAGTLTAEPPASIAYVPGSVAPDTVRAGQTIPVTASIRNQGGSPFVVDPGSTRFLITDGVESTEAPASGAPFVLAPGAVAVLDFPAVTFPAALASQGYPVHLSVHGTEWGQPESTEVISAAGAIRVVEPVPAVQVRGLDPGAPKQVAPGAAPFALWSLELQPLIPPGGAASSHLESLTLTALVDGGVAANPSASLARVTLLDSLGAILADVAPGSTNPIVIPLSAPLSLTGAAALLRMEVTLQPGASARSIALRLAADTDVDVRDDLTQTPVSVLAPGGLPFVALTSPAVTLFLEAHGYPNPFHAGREAVRLSYRLAGDASIRIAIYTLLGDLVRELALGPGTPGGTSGLNEVAWDGRNGAGTLVRPGVYVARIEGGGVSEQIKVGVLR